MNKLLIISALLIIVSKSTLAGDKPVIVKGRITIPNTEGLIIKLHYCPDYYSTIAPTIRGISYADTVKNGAFQFEIRDPSPFAYIQFEYVQWEKLSALISTSVFTWRLYLLGSDSLISFTVNKDECVFSEANKLMECQYKLYEHVFKDRPLGYSRTEDYSKVRERFKAHNDSVYQERLLILNRYKNAIKPLFSEILRLDFFADNERKNINIESILHMGLNADYLKANEPEELPQFLKKTKEELQYYMQNHLFQHYDTSHPEIKVLSRSYGGLLYCKQFCDAGLGMLATSVHIRPTLEQMTDIIEKSYTGKLKEKVLAAGFLSYYMSGEVRITEKEMDDVLAEMTTDDNRAIVQRMKDRRGYGKPAFNFKLKDSSGRIVTQEMFKGKFLVMDFWFTGCTGCAYLNKKMAPVYEHFKNNSNVVFISVNADEDVNKWRNIGLKSGEYTHPGSLNLFTNGLGIMDPILKYYDIMGFPTLILIGKDGKVVSGTPPKPVTPEATKRFIALVEEHLKS